MKRLIAALIAGSIFVVSVAAYAASNVSESATKQKKGALAMSFGGSTIALWNDEIKLMKPMVEKAGYTLLTHDPQFKVEKQVRDWEAWIAQGDVKAIMGWPIQVDALIPVTKKASDAGIPVIGYAVKWQGTKAALLTRPEQDGKRLAADAVRWIKKVYGNKPLEVAVLSDRQNDLTRLRVEGLVKGVKAGASNAKVYEVAALTRDDGYNAAKRQLTAHPHTTVWLSYSNDNLKGVYKALMDTGVKKNDPKYFLAGMDVTNEDLDLIRIPNSIYRQAYAFTSTELARANTALLIAAAEKKPLKDYYINARLVTKNNAKAFYVGKTRH